MAITFKFLEDATSNLSVYPSLAIAQPRWQLIIDGQSDDLLQAASVVRRHAIETGDIASIRLVRVLKDATSPDEVGSAIAAFRKWTATVALGRAPHVDRAV